MFLHQNYMSEFCWLYMFDVVFAALPLLLMLYGHYDGSSTNFLHVSLFDYFFFEQIIGPNLVSVCFRAKMTGPNFVGCTCLVLFLLRCCFCLCCMDIITGSALIFYTFYCLLNFFLGNHYS